MIGLAKLRLKAYGAVAPALTGAYLEFASATSWPFNHALNSTNVLVQCYDYGRSLFVPDEITITDANNASASLITAEAGSMTVIKGGATTSFSAQTTVNFNHGLNDPKIIVQVYDSNNKEIVPDSIQLVDNNNITVIFNTAQSGTVKVVKGNYTQTFTSSTTWLVDHGLKTLKVLAVCYDSSGYMIKPATQVISSGRRVTVTFGTATAGKAVAAIIDSNSSLNMLTTADMQVHGSILFNDEIWVWGYNQFGNTGTNDANNYSSPTTMVGGHKFKYVSGGEYTSHMLKADGSAWGCGRNNSGQIGDYTMTNRSSPVSILGGHSFIKIVAGQTIALALKANGSLWSWGANTNGQLGNNTVTHESSPISVVGGHSFIKMAAGQAMGAALKANGEVWTWGQNNEGQLGNDTITNQSSPNSIVGGHSFTQIVCAYQTCVALKADGSIWTWGHNTYGQLGDGTAVRKSSPISVIGGHSFVEISAGYFFTIARKTDGSIWAWGYNNYGQLGDNTIDYKSSPISVIGGHSFIQVKGFKYNGCGVKEDGSIWCWGLGGYGGNGDGTLESRSSPVSVVKAFY